MTSVFHLDNFIADALGRFIPNFGHIEAMTPVSLYQVPDRVPPDEHAE